MLYADDCSVMFSQSVAWGGGEKLLQNEAEQIEAKLGAENLDVCFVLERPRRLTAGRESQLGPAG